jgi:enoyl-CoA hydratase/carnithine racemase
MSDVADSNLRVAADEGVLRVTFDRAAKRNAMTTAMYSELADALELANNDDDVVVVLLRGAGGAFTAGNDLDDMLAHPVESDDAPPLRMLRALCNLDAVLVAAVDGPAVGIGTTLLLHCDLVYMTEAAHLRAPFVPLGLIPEAASTLLLPALVGLPRAAEMLLLGTRVDADTAVRWGLANEVVATSELLDSLVDEKLAALRALPPRALKATRRLLRTDAARTVGERLALDSALLREMLAEKLTSSPGAGAKATIP